MCRQDVLSCDTGECRTQLQQLVLLYLLLQPCMPQYWLLTCKVKCICLTMIQANNIGDSLSYASMACTSSSDLPLVSGTLLLMNTTATAHMAPKKAKMPAAPHCTLA